LGHFGGQGRVATISGEMNSSGFPVAAMVDATARSAVNKTKNFDERLMEIGGGEGGVCHHNGYKP